MRTLLENLREDQKGLLAKIDAIKVAGRYVANDIGQAIARIVELEKQWPGWRSIKNDPPPPKKMFVWRRPKGGGKYGLGLAYWTVSGAWADLSPDATEWLEIPES